MIFGIGVDIVQISRVEKAVGRFGERFSKKILALHEDANLPPRELAVHFAAKEAFVKALGIGFRGVTFKDIEIHHYEKGKPYFIVSDRIKKKFGSLQYHLSVSHEKDFVIAMAVIEKL